MTAARLRALVFIAVVIVAVGALAIAGVRRTGPRSPPQRPTLLLLTSLPLLFNEDFSLQGGGSPAVKKLQEHYRVLPISVTDAPELAKGRLLLMAHPLAQTAENLVTLDQWVRNGGRVLLLADPLLEWPSKRPLGDPLRPPPMFMDTGLLAHWGLQLDAPDARGAQRRQLGGYEVLTLSPGALRGDCAISSDRLVARCRVGKGCATIVADADLLNAGALGPAANRNLDGIIAELARLDQK
jgi:hypothetical protein